MDHAKKKHLKRYIGWAALAALTLLLAVMPLMAKQEAEADGPVASVLSATVQAGEVSSALHGGGTLAADGAEDVIIPTGVKITEFLVKNGDIVTEGTPLAVVDKVSVMTAITQVTETMEYLQDKMEAARDDTVSSTIRATAGGRVKKIFAQAGESVQDVMLRDGALAVLSLDGLMAVKIERGLDVSTGETVHVALADGTEVPGRVESNLDGIVVITVEDKGYEIGQNVTVTGEEGEQLGKGQLYIHNAWTATAITGTISTVNAKEESTLSSGASLFTLTDTDYEGELEHRANQHREYEDLLQELFRMYESGTINAPCDGSVSGVDKDSAHLLAAMEGDWEVQLLNGAGETNQGSWKVVLLSNVVYPDGECGSETCPLVGKHIVEECPKNICTRTKACAANNDKHQSGCYFTCISSDGRTDCPADYHKEDCIEGCVEAKRGQNCPSQKHYLKCVETCTVGTANKECPGSGDHYAECIKNCTKAEDCTAKNHYSICLSLCDESENCTAERHKDTCYMAKLIYYGVFYRINQVGTDGLIVDVDAGGYRQVARSAAGGWIPLGDNLNFMDMKESLKLGDTAKYKGKEGSIILVWDGYKNYNDSTPAKSGVSFYKEVQSSVNNNTGGLGSLSGLGGLSGMIGGFSGFGNYGGAAAQPTEDLFDLEGSVLMTVTPVDTMTLTIRLDEQDISKVSVEQTATVKVEALRGQTFDAQVSKVGLSGTNNGGSSKFTVELTLKAEENMLSGMSATAAIPLEVRQNVLTIPAAALVEDGAKTVVYTARDKETGDPASPVEVKTGISDGKNVEILSGLTEGDTVYYSYYDTLEMDTSAKADKYSFG